MKNLISLTNKTELAVSQKLKNLKIFSLVFIFGLLSLILCSNAKAAICVPQYTLPCNTIYIGAFGGWGRFTGNDVSQTGTVFFPAALGGTLGVHADGDLDSSSTSVWGLHVGYQFRSWQFNRCSPWYLVPSAEIEGYYLPRNTRSGQLLNPTPRIPGHTFLDSFPMRTGVLLANSVWNIEMPCMSRVHPYIGVGAGVAHISITDADSAQIVPPEANVNHFNSDTDDSDWTFAAQGKAGLAFNIACHWRLLAEYRLLYLAPTHYTFGSTQYPTHAATTNWGTNFNRMYNNMGLIGIEYRF